MSRTPETAAQNVLLHAGFCAQVFTESYAEYVDWGKKKRDPGLAPAKGYEARVKLECFRVLMYSALAQTAAAVRETGSALDVGATRQALLAALLGAAPSMAGKAEETKKRVAQYHAAWTAGPDRLQAELFKVLAEATGLAGTPFEKTINEVSAQGAKDWVKEGLRLVKSAVMK
jgi:hypothetical protein